MKNLLTTTFILLHGGMRGVYGYSAEEKIEVFSFKWFAYIVTCILLVCGSGLFSGLTVGYLSIDNLTIDLKLKTGTQKEKVQAWKVISVIKHRHLLLVTLLVSNACCLEALPIFLDSLVPSWIAILISVTMVLFFGEIIPQAACVGPH